MCIIACMISHVFGLDWWCFCGVTQTGQNLFFFMPSLMQLLGMKWLQHACIQLWQPEYPPLLDEGDPQSHCNVHTRQEDQLSDEALHSHPDTVGKEVPQDSWGMVLDMWQTSHFCSVPVLTPGLIYTLLLVEELQFTSASSGSLLVVLESNFLKCKGPSFLQDLGERDR